jgi:LacI family transcriptional regulator, repressor for deo operon, udp, cdd, tsx, nupC, and nupG
VEEARPASRMKEVAKRAGVSTATVSRALSTPDRVSEQTRQRIEVAIAELNYTLNTAGRTLRRSDTGIVLVLLPDIGNPFFAKLVKGIEQRARELSYSVLIGDTGRDNSKLETYALQIDAKRADGLILLNGRLPARTRDEPKGPHGKVVLVSERVARVALPTVGIDNVGASRRAVQHLLALQHRNVWHIAGPVGNILTRERIAGYRAALDTAGRKVGAQRIVHGDFTIEGGRRAMRALMKGRSRPTAIFAANDETAIGAIVELAGIGLSVPSDVSVVGFDDIEVAGSYNPPLTTVRQPRFEMGYKAMSLLGERLRNSGTKARQIVLPSALIVRASTAPRRGA